MFKKEETTKEYLKLLYRKNKLAIISIILVTMVLFVFFVLLLSANKNYLKENNELLMEGSSLDLSNDKDSYIADDSMNAINESEGKVYITGEIANPGVYNIKSGDRIEDIIKYAGGITDEAALEYVNLAEIVVDEQHIIIPSISDIENNEYLTSNFDDGKININKASEDELMEITGVGEVTAENIVEYREENGDFLSIEDIKNVSGVGEKTFEKMEDEIKV